MISKRSKRLRGAMGGHARAKHSARKKLSNAHEAMKQLAEKLLEVARERDRAKRALRKIYRIAALSALLVVFLPRHAAAETYKFTGGAATQHANRCASPSAMKRLEDWTRLAELTLGHDQATLAIDSKPFGADEFAPPYARFIITDQLTVITWVDPIDCAKSDCSQLRASIAIIQRLGDAVCYERWNGRAEVVK